MTAEQRRSRISARLHEAHQPISATALAKELGPSGIRVNCVAPGVILTDMCAQVEPEILEEMAQDTPVGRNGTPADVAQAMAYLADAEFVTGNVLNVDGGYVI